MAKDKTTETDAEVVESLLNGIKVGDFAALDGNGIALVPMRKDGMEMNVNPDTVAEHAKLGWVRV